MRKVARKGEEGATWVPVPCWHDCGGRCVIKALVRDGEVLRMKTDDVHPDTWERPQARACAIGRAMRFQVFGDDRLKHPMKRAHWTPENPCRELRGEDTWERITWDEALDYAASELAKAKDRYGNESILYMNIMNLEGCFGQVLSAWGGYFDCTGTQSAGTFDLATAEFGFGGEEGGTNDRMDLENSDYVVLMGHNAAWGAFGNAALYLKHAKECGTKFVFVGPEYSITAGFTNALWIPVRPGTDTAFLLGVAYSMITRDEDGSLIDWDFLGRCTVGFDADHMPADARTGESFCDYVLGRSDGVPKTQDWASEISGTPLELIDEFADIVGHTNKISFHSNAAPARCKGAENYPQMLMTIAAMGGHFGRPGNSCANDMFYGAMNGGMITYVPIGGPSVRGSNAGNPVKKCVSLDMIWDAIVDGEYWDAGNIFPGGEPHAPVRKTCDVHVLVSEGHNFLATQANVHKGIEAFRKVDFVFASAYYLKFDARYADIVVPVAMRWELAQPSAFISTGMQDKELSFASSAPLARPGECRSDREIASALAERLDLDYGAFGPPPDKQGWFDQIAQTMVVHANGDCEFVARIEQDDLDRYGVTGTARDGIMPLEQYLEEGVYRRSRTADDEWASHIPYADFVADPEIHPLASTVSGKLEIYCQAKSDWYDMVNGYADGGEGVMDFVRVSPLPKYLDAPENYRGTFSDWDTRVKGTFPLQMTHVHYPRRAHTDCDNVAILREAFRNPVFVNVNDARERGVESGDIIRVFNGNGAFLRPASVTRTVMPGVVIVPHGASARFDSETGLDLAGADNVLTSSNCTTTPFLNSWNSNLVQFEKYEGPVELRPDCEVGPVVPQIG